MRHGPCNTHRGNHTASRRGSQCTLPHSTCHISKQVLLKLERQKIYITHQIRYLCKPSSMSLFCLGAISFSKRGTTWQCCSFTCMSYKKIFWSFTYMSFKISKYAKAWRGLCFDNHYKQRDSPIELISSSVYFTCICKKKYSLVHGPLLLDNLFLQIPYFFCKDWTTSEVYLTSCIFFHTKTVTGLILYLKLVASIEKLQPE